MTLRVVTANVNGIRAAFRRGGMDWLADCGADVICLQEVRATADQVGEVLGAAGFGEWDLALATGARGGHAGVALLSRAPMTDVVVGVGGGEFDDQGRWVEATVPQPAGPGSLRIASVYVHTGEAEGPRLEEKDRFLTAMGAWLAKRADEPALVCGDLNVAHTRHDIKNWRGNRGRAGFLESEQAHLDRWYADPPDGLGWTDLGRRFAGVAIPHPDEALAGVQQFGSHVRAVPRLRVVGVQQRVAPRRVEAAQREALDEGLFEVRHDLG